MSERERETVGAMRVVIYAMASVLALLGVGFWLLFRG